VNNEEPLLDITHQILAQLTEHGYLILFLAVFAEILGVPLPAAPLLLTAGALSATGRLSLGASWLAGILACMMADLLWYSVGRRWGTEVLEWLHTLWRKHTEDCRSRAFGLTARFGGRAMLVAKFLPGINMISAPLAGIGLPLSSYLAWEIPGSALYIGAWLVAGRLLGSSIEKLLSAAHGAAGAFLGIVLIGALITLVLRSKARRKWQCRIEGSRITCEELHDLIAHGASPVIVDLRHPLDMLTDSHMIAGAVRLSPEEISWAHDDLVQVGQIVLYCTCPKDESSARMASQLEVKGVGRVRWLVGGLATWEKLGYPIEDAPDRIHWRARAHTLSGTR
jgi:membrane protein DedA with SNARE-associated domain/rhodanese-related sulfurtransferase